jgi:YhcH/YjgK/YiaL family protein
MIKDYLRNAEVYYNLSQNLKKGLLWLEKTNLEDLADGRYEIDGEKIYASVQTYETKDDANYESHRRYIDIQYIVKGAEKIGVTDLSNCKTCIEYDDVRDLEFYNIECCEEYIGLKDGQFAIFYPHDAHKPSISIDTKSSVKKIVVKVKID